MSDTAPLNIDTASSKLLKEPIQKQTCRTSDEEHVASSSKICVNTKVMPEISVYPSGEQANQVEKKQASFFERSAYHKAPDASAIPCFNWYETL